jgi:hypothetical protein
MSNCAKCGLRLEPIGSLESRRKTGIPGCSLSREDIQNSCRKHKPESVYDSKSRLRGEPKSGLESNRLRLSVFVRRSQLEEMVSHDGQGNGLVEVLAMAMDSLGDEFPVLLAVIAA